MALCKDAQQGRVCINCIEAKTGPLCKEDESVPQLGVEWPVCSGCGNQIDPEVCGCGVSKENHDPWNAGHSFVPVGCDCLRPKKGETDGY